MPALHPRRTRVWLSVAAAGFLTACAENDAPDDDLSSTRAPEIARVASAGDALSGSQTSKLDPASMNDAEVRQGVGAGPVCMFKYTASGHPVLVASMEPDGSPHGGIVKLNGYLVRLNPARTDAAKQNGRLELAAEQIRLTVSDDGRSEQEPDREQRRAADMVFEIGDSLRVGYRGYLICQPSPPARSPRH